jgi:seryl-tRNA synthetase
VIDIKAARSDPAAWRSALARKAAAEEFDALLEADARWRAATAHVDELRARSKPKTKGKPSAEELEALRAVKDELRRAEDELADVGLRRRELLDRVPNPPDASAPDGATEDDGE